MNRHGTFFKMLLVMVNLLILAVVMTGSAAAETDVYLGVAFHPFTLDGGNNTCVDYLDSDIGPTRNCDPVNLVFPDWSWMEVRDLLLNDDWSLSGGGSSQWLHYDGTQLYVEDEQLYKPGTLFGPRYHIRLWQAPGDTLVTFAAVHHEDFFHNIDMDWEGAEAYVAGALCAPDCGQTGSLATQIGIQEDEGDAGTWRTNGDGTRHWINDGSATVIPVPGPPDEAPEVTIFLPAVGSTVSGLTPVEIQAVDEDDPAGALAVAWRIDGGGWSPATYNPAGDYYEASWDTTTVTDGDHLFYAQATDSAQNTAGTSHTVNVDNPNLPPFAGFSFTCNSLSCDFDAAASYDPDGGDMSVYAWDFGDSDSGSGMLAGHTYATAGTYAVRLTVTDDEGATGSDSQEVTVVGTPATTMHVGDLEGAAIVKKSWSARVTITIHDAGEGLVSDAIVTGVWSDDPSEMYSCETDGSGACSLTSAELSKKTVPSIIFSVTDIDHDSLSYDAAGNHDPQNNSSGSAIQINKDGTTQDPGAIPDQPPVASFTYDCLDLTCTFDASASTDPDGGDIAAYAWDFGDGTGAGGVIASHTFAAAGTHQVTLTVTDDEGITADDQQTVSVGQTGDLMLTAVGYKVKGVHHVDLTWSGAASSQVDIFRDGGLIVTWSSGSVPYTDNTGQKGGASYLYQVCEQGAAICSEVVIVTF